MAKRYYALSRDTSIPGSLVFDDEEGVVYIDTGDIQYSNVDFTLADGKNLVLDVSTGSKIGTAADQKLAFYGATPIAQGAAVADASGGATVDAEARTAINTLLARLRALGLIAT